MPDNDHSPAFWQSVASTFKTNPAVVFDVFNEPYDPTDPRSGSDPNAQDQVTWNCWDTGTQNGTGGGAPCDTSAYDVNGIATTTYRVAGLQTLVDAIRGTGAGQPILAGGLDYANDLGQWATHAPNDPLNQEAASFHNYQGKACETVTCWNSTIAAVAASVPVVTGEFDEDNFTNPSCANKTPTTFAADYMNWADQHGVSYLAWGWEVLSAQEISGQGCSAFYLTSDPSGTPAAPNGTAVHDHLAALASAGTVTSLTTTTTRSTTAATTKATSTTTTTSGSATTTTRASGSGGAHPIRLTAFQATVQSGGSAIVFQLRASVDTTGTLTGRTAHPFAVLPSKQRRRRVLLGTVRFRLSAGQSESVLLRLSGHARVLLARRRSLPVLITVTLGSGTTRSVTQRRLTLTKSAAHNRRG